MPFDDALTKLDKELLVPDRNEPRARVSAASERRSATSRARFSSTARSSGPGSASSARSRSIPGEALGSAVRAAIEEEALAFPIAGTTKPTIRWAEIGR